MVRGKRISFIGSGVMAEAMINGLTEGKAAEPTQIVASDPLAARRDQLHGKYGIGVTGDNREACRTADIVTLAVKPQVMGGVLRELKGSIRSESLVVSIAAGISLQAISQGLGHGFVVRSMPNTPGRIGRGITVWTALNNVCDQQRGQARALLGALGEEVFVAEEKYLDMATALSGTGPMYVFLFMESLIDAGVCIGLPRDLAERLVLATVSGSAEYAVQAKKHLAQLRSEVTSPAGTTSEALYCLQVAGFNAAVQQAVYAAYQRSCELGRS